MLRAIREICPRWVVGENVLGIVNWDGGLVFEQVHADLEAEGYEVQAFVLPACSVDAPHLRYRTWFVVHRADAGTESMREWEDGIRSDMDASDSSDNGCRTRDGEGCEIREWSIFSGEQEGSEIRGEHNRCDCERTITNSDNNGLEYGTHSGTSGEVSIEKTECPSIDPTSAAGGRWIVTDSNCERREECDIAGQSERTYIAGCRNYENGCPKFSTNAKGERLSERNGESSRHWPHATAERHYGLSRWENFPTQSPVRSRDDGFPIPMDGITLPKWRTESIKAYGNAIVPQVVYRIFDAINKYEKL